MDKILPFLNTQLLPLIVASVVTFIMGHRIGIKYYKKRYQIAFSALGAAVADRIYAEKRYSEALGELEFLRKSTPKESNDENATTPVRTI